MGNYAITTELKARFENTAAVAHVTDSEDDATPNENVLSEALNAAEGIIDSYVGRRHSTPVAVSGDTVLANWMKSMTLDIGVYRLLQRGGVIPDAIIRSYEEVIDWLKAVGNGDAVLPAAAQQATTAAIDPISEWGSGTGDDSNRVFTRASQENI